MSLYYRVLAGNYTPPKIPNEPASPIYGPGDVFEVEETSFESGIPVYDPIEKFGSNMFEAADASATNDDARAREIRIGLRRPPEPE